MTTKTKQLQVDEDYHMACQSCGQTKMPLHILPMRNEINVVGMVFSCDDCHVLLSGKTFDTLQQ
ncbi:hypothetical protein LCGC14_2439610 [marine sediment metagenome]|uniref:Uncharacterized protein n=1 Tax=marine sediment metagenome TaxID=412755 RepID=A0A0F9C6U2_9ZZZZ